MKKRYVLLILFFSLLLMGALSPKAAFKKMESDLKAAQSELELIYNRNSNLEEKIKRLQWICKKNGVDTSLVDNESFWPKPCFFGQLNIGDRAYLKKYNTKIIQIIDATNMIASIAIDIQQGNLLTTKHETVWIEGISTVGLTDDSKITIPHVMKVLGTKQYAAFVGTNTVYHLVLDTEFKDWY